MTDYEEILVCALRYALDRRTYIVSTVCRYIADNMPKLSEYCILVMGKDIYKALKIMPMMECDAEEFKKLDAKIKKELQSRIGVEQTLNKEVCSDNRFTIIEKAKEDLVNKTNIETKQDEMKMLDSLLFRCWQMGWLKEYEVKEVE